MDDLKQIGKTLQARRKAAGFKSARAFAECLGIPPTRYAEYEQGRCAFTYEQAWEFADALDCTMDELGGREWPQAPAVPDMPPDEQRLMGCYRDLDRERKDRLLKTAQDALAAKKDEPSSLALPQQRSA